MKEKYCQICGGHEPHRHKHKTLELWFYHGCNTQEDRDKVIKEEQKEV